MHGALEGQMREEVAKDLLYVPSRLGRESKFDVARSDWRNDMTQKYILAG